MRQSLMFWVSCGRIGVDTIRKQPVIVRLGRLTWLSSASFHSIKLHSTVSVIKIIVPGVNLVNIVPSTPPTTLLQWAFLRSDFLVMFISSFIDAVAVSNHDALYFCLTLDIQRIFDTVLVSLCAFACWNGPQRMSRSTAFAVWFAMAMLTTAVGPGNPPLVLTGLVRF